MTTELVVGFVTTSPETSLRIATSLIEADLAACVNVVGRVQSVYKWDGETKVENEALLVIKSTKNQVDAINRKLREIHPYDVFELVTLDITGGNQQYLEWVAAAAADRS